MDKAELVKFLEWFYSHFSEHIFKDINETVDLYLKESEKDKNKIK